MDYMHQEALQLLTLSPSLVDPFLPSLPSSPSIPRLRAKAMRSLAGVRTLAGKRWNWRIQMARAHVLRAFGVGRSSARGIASRAVRIELSSVSEEEVGKNKEIKYRVIGKRKEERETTHQRRCF
jgi:hypothetical protein